MNLFPNIARVMSIAVLLAIAACPVQAAKPDTCFSDWSDAAPIVAREGLIAARDVHALARRQHASEIMRITLCREAAGYVYRLLLRDDRGRISSLKIDATGAHVIASTPASAVETPSR